MTSEENVDREPTPGEIKRARIQAIVLGSSLVIALISIVYGYVARTELNAKNKEVLELQQQVHQRDSLLEVNTKELQKQVDRAEQNLKKAMEKPKPKAKDTSKKNKSKKK